MRFAMHLISHPQHDQARQPDPPPSPHSRAHQTHPQHRTHCAYVSALHRSRGARRQRGEPLGHARQSLPGHPRANAEPVQRSACDWQRRDAMFADDERASPWQRRPARSAKSLHVCVLAGGRGALNQCKVGFGRRRRDATAVVVACRASAQMHAVQTLRKICSESEVPCRRKKRRWERKMSTPTNETKAKCQE
ncbi:hypothetical protein EJ07DRAFT_156117 [Lizonia empirigonia]|nr:hypothetical protein EJ07DRAFT_156117 [Lizonia empirigonia]